MLGWEAFKSTLAVTTPPIAQPTTRSTPKPHKWINPIFDQLLDERRRIIEASYVARSNVDTTSMGTFTPHVVERGKAQIIPASGSISQYETVENIGLGTRFPSFSKLSKPEPPINTTARSVLNRLIKETERKIRRLERK